LAGALAAGLSVETAVGGSWSSPAEDDEVDCVKLRNEKKRTLKFNENNLTNYYCNLRIGSPKKQRNTTQRRIVNRRTDTLALVLSGRDSGGLEVGLWRTAWELAPAPGKLYYVNHRE
jgi:hypothetical protein